MNYIGVVLGLLFIFGGVIVPVEPAQAQAQESCECFCTSTLGAVNPKGVGVKISSNECQDACIAKKERVAAFACGANQYPTRTPYCFSKGQCDEVGGEWDSGYQPEECATSYRYCYPDKTKQAKVDLQVNIGSYKTSIDFGEYIGQMYKWLLSSSVVIATVLLMIGGLRYVLASSSGNVDGGKKMIINAVVGLLLLLCTYLILFTVNPDLVSLAVPRLPLLKQVSLIDNASCEDLIKEYCGSPPASGCLKQKFDFSGPEQCGTVATVLQDEDGKPVPDGTVCNFSSCGNKDSQKYCVPADEPVCMTCEQLTPTNASGVMPNSALCSAFNNIEGYQRVNQLHQTIITPNYSEFDPSYFKQCLYSRDVDVGGNMVSTGSCVAIEFDCSTIRTCDDYEHIKVKTDAVSGGSVKLHKIDLGKNSGVSGSKAGVAKVLLDNAGDFTMGSFCDADPALADMCKWNRTDNKKNCYTNGKVADTVSNTGLSALTVIDYDCKIP